MPVLHAYFFLEGGGEYLHIATSSWLQRHGKTSRDRGMTLWSLSLLIEWHLRLALGMSPNLISVSMENICGADNLSCT